MRSEHKYINNIQTYFGAVAQKDPKKFADVFENDCEVFFAGAGVMYGLSEFQGFVSSIIGLIDTIEFDEFHFIVSENTVVSEGAESGVFYDGYVYKGLKICNVFDFNPTTGLIKRMYVYTDPSLGKNSKL